MLIISVDHEVFGNGSGCLDACVRLPVDSMLSVADKFSAPLTFFVEALEFEAMQHVGIPGINSVIEQLIAAYRSGHDIQLHIHPQWDGATWDGSDWRVNSELWRTGSLDAESAFRLLQRGKSWIEAMLGSDFPEYQCIAFRAGGWCIQPSHETVTALMKLGFQIDSTVAPGLRNLAKGEWADFRNVPDKPFWKTNSDVCCADPTGLWEMPIVTGKIGRMKHLQAVRLARAFATNGMAEGCVGSYQGGSSMLQSIQGKLGKIKDLGNVMLDISTMPAKVLIEISEQWMRRFADSEKPVPLVAIAHTKNFTDASERNMQAFLSWAQQEGIEMGTYGRWLGAINEKN